MRERRRETLKRERDIERYIKRDIVKDIERDILRHRERHEGKTVVSRSFNIVLVLKQNS